MAFKLFLNENIAQGISGGSSSKIQAGISDFDPGTYVESGITLPYVIDKSVSWVDYSCEIGVTLDSGIVVHRPLPQANYPPDTLSMTDIYDYAKVDQSTEGIDIASVGQFTDFVQRMANSIYRFFLRGYAIRIGYKIPIPGLKKVGLTPVIPDDEPKKQYAVCRSPLNFCGVPVYFAEWELWYTVATAPQSKLVVPPNLAQHIRGDAIPPSDGIDVPVSPVDQQSVSQQIVLSNPISAP